MSVLDKLFLWHGEQKAKKANEIYIIK